MDVAEIQRLIRLGHTVSYKRDRRTGTVVTTVNRSPEASSARASGSSTVTAAASLAAVYGAPLMLDALTGTREQVELAATLVRRHVAEHGPDAAAELARLALGVSDPVLQLNLARSATALEDASPSLVMRAHANAQSARRRRGRRS